MNDNMKLFRLIEQLLKTVEELLTVQKELERLVTVQKELGKVKASKNSMPLK